MSFEWVVEFEDVEIVQNNLIFRVQLIRFCNLFVVDYDGCFFFWNDCYGFIRCVFKGVMFVENFGVVQMDICLVVCVRFDVVNCCDFRFEIVNEVFG